MSKIPYGRQEITDDDIKAVIEALRSDYITQGPKIFEFENAFAKYVGAKHAIACTNGTAALHLGIQSLDLRPGDKVITSPITFAATANCIQFQGGLVDFVDIDPKTYLMDLNKVESKLKKAKRNEYKGILPVDFAGYPLNLEELKTLADCYGLWILEDACHAPGAYFIDSKKRKQYCGNCFYNDISTFSFHPVKHITSGEGGMVTTNNDSIYQKLIQYRNHGITKDPNQLLENHGPWYYEISLLGQNYRLTDFQCSLGISQLSRAETNLLKRHEIANRYNSALRNSEIQLPQVEEGFFHAYHLYVIRISKRDALYHYLRKNNILSQVHYIPLHLQPLYKKLGWIKGDLPEAERYYSECLSIPIFPTLSRSDQDYVIEILLEFLK